MPDEMENVYICASSDLLERGKGVRFPIMAWGEDAIGFVIRHEGVLRAYLNRCVHLPVELDNTEEGCFFDMDKEHLVCGRHGALFMPDTGRCALGASAGTLLYAISVTEEDGKVYWHPNDYFRPVAA